MTKDHVEQATGTVPARTTSTDRAVEAHRDMITNPPKLTRAEQAFLDLKLNPPAPDPLEEAKRAFLASQERHRGFAKLYEDSPTVRNFKLLGSTESESLGYRAATGFADAFKSTNLAKLFPESPYAASLKKQIADMSGMTGVASTISSHILPSITASMLAGIKVPSVEDLVGRDVLMRLSASSATAVAAALHAQGRVITRARTAPRLQRTTVAPRRPAPRSDDVDTFLAAFDPELVENHTAVFNELTQPNGASNCANSAVELLQVLMSTLVRNKFVWMYMTTIERNEKSKWTDETPPYRRHFDLLAMKYDLDHTLLMRLTHQGGLVTQFHTVKHHRRNGITNTEAMQMLLPLVEQLEDLLKYLAGSVRLPQLTLLS